MTILHIEGKAKAVGADLAMQLLRKTRNDLSSGAVLLSTHYIAVGEVDGHVKLFDWPYASAPEKTRVLFRAGLVTKVRERLLAGDSLTDDELASARYEIEKAWP